MEKHRYGRPGGREHRPEPDRQAQLNGMIESGVQALLSEMQQGKSDRLSAYLAFSSRFHQYSLHNQLLIYSQKPEATRVAGYRTWQELGYQVKRGEQAIHIFAPRPYTKTHEEQAVVEGNEETKTTERSGVRFVSVPVFDSSQLADLDKKPLPAFWTPLPDDQQELTTRLEGVVRRDGIQLADSRLLGAAQGVSYGGRIDLQAGLDSRRRFLVLTHEYGHELMHRGEDRDALSRSLKECHAEAVSYIVAHHFGIHNPFSSDYLQHWGNTPETLLAELSRVTTTASTIIDKLTPKEPASATPRRETTTRTTLPTAGEIFSNRPDNPDDYVQHPLF